jgi:transcriptional regulator with XRE-family HTH domain
MPWKAGKGHLQWQEQEERMEIRFNSARLLELQGLKSDRELARDLGISRSQLYRIRSGASFPGRRFLENLADCYPQFPVSEFFICL